MRSKHYRPFVIILALCLCITGLPAIAMGDEAVSPTEPAVQQSEATAVWYRTHATGNSAWGSDAEGWRFFNPAGDLSAQSDNAQALDSIEMIFSSDQYTGGVEYRTVSKDGKVSESWLSDGFSAASNEGIYGVEARLTGSVAETHELWYRTRTATSGWLAWAHAGEASGSAQSPIVEMQVCVTSRDNQLRTNDELATFEGEQPAESAEQPTENTEQPANEDAVKAQAETTDGAELEGMAGDPSIEYQTHVQTYGWQDWVKDGEQAGTSGESKRLEGIKIRLKNASGSVVYATHAQTYGWLDEVADGELAGTTGESKRLESVTIRLTGDIAKTHDVWYRAHVQTYGWQSWVSNGAEAGTTGLSKRVEAIEVRLVKKGDPVPVGVSEETPSLRFSTHVQTYGWLEEVASGQTSGTTGESKRLEGIKATLSGVDGGISYRTHVQTYGWQDWVADGEVSGTTGESKRLEAVQFKLTGAAADNYDIWYRCHVQRFGWLDWASNGDMAGSEGFSYRMESIQLVILPKGSDAPGATDSPYKKRGNTLNGVDISGWQRGIDIYDTEGDFFIIKATEGVSTPDKPATRYNPWYTQWANEVLDSGRLLGFYHYANGEDPIEEAEAFYDAIKDYKGVAIACLDWEGQGNKLFDTGMDVAWCKKFMDHLQSLYGGIPFLYTSKNYCNAYDWTSVAAEYPLWGAQYADSNDTHGYQANPWQSSNPWGAWGSVPTIFQYSGTGVLDHNGGMEYFDMNIFYGTRDDWYTYV